MENNSLLGLESSSPFSCEEKGRIQPVKSSLLRFVNSLQSLEMKNSQF